MDFKLKTPAEFEALTDYQKEKYLDQKAAYEIEQNKQAAKDAAEKAIEGMKADLKKEQADLIANLNDEQKEAIKEATEKQAKEYATKMEELEAAMKRSKMGEINTRMKGFSDHIIEKFSTPDGEQMIKDFFSGQRAKFNVTIGDDKDEDFNATIKALGVPSGGVAPQFTPIVGPGHDDFHARNIIPVYPTISDLVKYVQFTYTGETAGFATVAAGAQKPTLGYTGDTAEAPVRKIAGLLDVQDELLDDVVGFRAWLAYELPQAYLDAEDYQIFKGDGTGTNLLGLWYQAGNQSFPQGSVTAASNIIDKVVAGVTQVRKLKRRANAAVISAVAWQEIWINKGNTDEYTYPIVFDANGTMRIAGIAIYWSNVFSDAEGLVGDFARGAAIWQRRAMTMGYFEQNKDNVEKNVITVRLEGRIALSINYPEAFKKLLLTITT